MSGLDSLKAVCLQNPKDIIFFYININSIRNRFSSLCSLVSSHADILSIAETKLDYSFSKTQLLIPNFHQLRLDISTDSGGLLVFVRSQFQQEFYLIIGSHRIFQLYHLKLILEK